MSKTLKRALSVASASLLVLLLAGAMLFRFAYPGPVEIVRASSPDGKLELIIFEQVPTPRGLMQSPYSYKMQVVDKATNKPLPGNFAWQGNDSASIPASNFGVAWTATDVTVTCGRQSNRGDFASGVQRW